MDFLDHRDHPNLPDLGLEVPLLFLRRDSLFRSLTSRAQRLCLDVHFYLGCAPNLCLYRGRRFSRREHDLVQLQRYNVSRNELSFELRGSIPLAAIIIIKSSRRTIPLFGPQPTFQ